MSKCLQFAFLFKTQNRNRHAIHQVTEISKNVRKLGPVANTVVKNYSVNDVKLDTEFKMELIRIKWNKLVQNLINSFNFSIRY